MYRPLLPKKRLLLRFIRFSGKGERDEHRVTKQSNKIITLYPKDKCSLHKPTII